MPPRQPIPDPYAVLGVDAGATQDEIRRAYRALAKTHHPDRNQHRQAEAEQAIKRLNAAYELLKDERRRATYDLQRQRDLEAERMRGSFHGRAGSRTPSGMDPQFTQSRTRPEFHTGPASGRASATDADGAAWRAKRDAEGSFFNRWQQRRRDHSDSDFGPGPDLGPASGRRTGSTAPPHPNDPEYQEIRLTFKQAVRGITKTIMVGSNTACKLCDGTGRVESEAPLRCGSCRRQGLRSHTTMAGVTFHLCKFCGWSEESSVRCPGCAGTGRSKGHRIRLAIPPGLRDGAKLRHRVPGMERPVIIDVRVGGSKVFERGVGDSDDQLMTTVNLTREVAEFGGKAKVPTIEGSVQVKVPPGIKDGTCMKLSGRGVKRRDGGFGDLIVRFHVASGTGSRSRASRSE